MKTIGLVGGMSMESTIEYCKIINDAIKKELGGNNSAKIVMQSVNFQEIVDRQFAGKWDELGKMLSQVANNLENNGADFVLICTNLMHKVAPCVKENISVPLIHIADQTALEIKRRNINKVGLLGTIFTMEEDFYTATLNKHGIEVLIPDQDDRKEISRIIYEELCRGIFTQKSREFYEATINKLVENGAQGVVMGCTEIPLLLEEKDVPLFNTTEIHALSAVKLALENKKMALA